MEHDSAASSLETVEELWKSCLFAHFAMLGIAKVKLLSRLNDPAGELIPACVKKTLDWKGPALD